MNAISKLPLVTFSYWIMKICATTLGETAGDLLAQTLHVGYGISFAILLAFFFIVLALQLVSKKYHPIVYWLVILATSTSGTTMSDFMDRTLGLGYAFGTLLLVSLLISTLFVWKKTERSLSVTDIKTMRAEIFYWTAILFSNTLGTALGDFLADDSGLGFAGGALLIGGLLLFVVLAYYQSKISHIILFWIAFVLTRPFGATFGDLLTKTHEKGGLDFGTKGSSIILFAILIFLVAKEFFKDKKANRITESISLP